MRLTTPRSWSSANAFAATALLASIFSPMAHAAGCPAGTIQLSVTTETRGDTNYTHRRCQQLACDAQPDLPRGMISQGQFVTRADCQDASRQIVRMVNKRDSFEKKLAQLKAWDTGLRRDSKEFEAMREEATEDLAWEFIEHLPVAEGLDALKDIQAMKGVNIEKIKAAYDATKGLLETGRGIITREDKERADLIVSGNLELRKAMLGMAGADEKTRKLLDAISKVYDIGAKGVLAASRDKLTTRDKLKFAMDVVEVVQPWWGVAVLAENGTERGGSYYYSGLALQSLNDAQSSNWNARRYFSERIDRLNIDIDTQQTTLTKYQQSDH